METPIFIFAILFFAILIAGCYYREMYEAALYEIHKVKEENKRLKATIKRINDERKDI